jgi:hypothetical protein
MTTAHPSQKLARGLGWFSIGLGLAEVLIPGRLARAFGMRGEETLLRFYGAREIANGLGILASSQPRPWMWGRVAGDAMDLATLAARLNHALPREQRNIALAIGAVAGVTAADIACARALAPREPRPLLHDYSDRSGFARPPEQMRGVASDFTTPRDMRTPVVPPTFH